MIKIEIFNVRGQRVRTLKDGFTTPGTHRIEWDGRDDSGTRLGSGNYLYRISGLERPIIQKLVLLQ